MNVKLTSFVCLLLVCFYSCSQKDKSNDAEIDKLISEMTIEEKVGQMAQITLDVIGKGKNKYSSFEPFTIDSIELKKAIVDYHVGSVLNTSNNRARTPEAWNEIMKVIQDYAMSKTRMKIPVIYGVDQIHGPNYTVGATLFPQQITLAASFNKKHAYNMAVVTAYETRACGIPWNFSPVLDLGADPRFSRQFEGFGEDPYVCTEFGREMIKGYEGEDGDIAHPEKLASCPKHFLGYAVPISGKDRTPAYIPEHVLREYHLPAFKAAIEQGAHTIMINSGIINGVSVHASYDILTKLLREELGFQGLIVSDWADIINLYRRDKIAANVKEAIKLSINAGIDMSMISYDYEDFCTNLVELVKEGEVKESRIDDAVRRILKVKKQLNLWNKPLTVHTDYPKFASDEFAKLSYDAAAEAITLLKNSDSILPLSPNARILLAGPNANSMRTLNGAWSYSWQGEKAEEFTEKYNTIYEAIRNKFGEANVKYIAGVKYKEITDADKDKLDEEKETKYYDEEKDRFEEAIAAARSVDYIILCLGENSYTEKPGDLNDLYLSDLQTKLAEEMIKTGKPVILVLNEGRPRCVSKFVDNVKAVIQTYLPSNYGGDALADILAGDVNPSGRLPYNYPAYPNSLVNYYHKPSEEQIALDGAYNYESDYNPQWEFGSGLSYTTFTYSNMKLSKEVINQGEELTISVDVTNAGTRVGKETVLLYTSDLVASITPDVKRLRRFEKIELQPGETKTVTFIISSKDLAFVNLKNQWVCEPGEFEVAVDSLKAVFTVND